MVNALLLTMVETKSVGISLPRDILEKIDREGRTFHEANIYLEYLKSQSGKAIIN
jgi:hypothetical protein